MTTTALFIELLLTGLQAALWITLIVFSLFGFDWISLDRIKGFEAIAAIVLFPIVYPLGVCVDYLADEMLKHWDQRLRIDAYSDKTQSAMKLLINTKHVSLASYLGYTRSRIRISRSAALKFALITLTSVIFTLTRLDKVLGPSTWGVATFEFVLGAALTGLALLAWFRISQTFFKWIERGFKMDSNIGGDSESLEIETGAKII